MRVLVLNNVPSPNLKALFEKLGHKSGWELTVCYVSIWHQNVGWVEEKLESQNTHRTVILDQRMPRVAVRFGSRAAGALALAGLLFRERPDYLICYGYTLLPQITAILWSIITNTPFALSGDSNIYCDRTTRIKRILKRWWVGQVTKRAAALLSIGIANRMFWESYGARPEQLYETRFAVDNDFFKRSIDARKGESDALRANLGLTDRIIFLFVGRLIKRKNVDLIIRAICRLNDDRIALVIAGSGIERDSLQELAGGDPRVVFAGSVEQCRLPLYYAMADVMVLPAREEPWGLVINEAMASGLAVIAHRHCGATLDLVRNDNGVALETFSVEELAGKMKLLATNSQLRRSMQERSQLKIDSWTIDSAAQGIIRAVEASHS
jgi:glycosyltransferase involved in cell wall biosynthesis